MLNNPPNPPVPHLVPPPHFGTSIINFCAASSEGHRLSSVSQMSVPGQKKKEVTSAWVSHCLWIYSRLEIYLLFNHAFTKTTGCVVNGIVHMFAYVLKVLLEDSTRVHTRELRPYRTIE